MDFDAGTVVDDLVRNFDATSDELRQSQISLSHEIERLSAGTPHMYVYNVVVEVELFVDSQLGSTRKTEPQMEQCLNRISKCQYLLKEATAKMDRLTIRLTDIAQSDHHKNQ
jgi:hypothetical protein